MKEWVHYAIVEIYLIYDSKFVMIDAINAQTTRQITIVGLVMGYKKGISVRILVFVTLITTTVAL
jgi:hypothetical protein